MTEKQIEEYYKNKKYHPITINLTKEMEKLLWECGGIGSKLGSICFDLIRTHPTIKEKLLSAGKTQKD